MAPSGTVNTKFVIEISTVFPEGITSEVDDELHPATTDITSKARINERME